MQQTPSFFSRGLVLLLITSACGRLSAQTDMLQQQVVSGNNKNSAGLIPVKKKYDEDAKSWYAIYNTADTLHIYLAVTDPLQQRKIAMNGIELWIDSKGKKNKRTGILFPFVANNNKAGSPVQAPRQDMNSMDPFDNRERHDTVIVQQLEKTLATQHEMKLTGFKEELNGVQNTNHPSGIHVLLHFVKDTLVYEAQLPLNTLPEALAVNSHMSVGLIEKGMFMPEFNGAGTPPPDGGGPGGDGGMPPPGGPGPGGPGGEDGMRIFEDNAIWYRFSLQETALTQ